MMNCHWHDDCGWQSHATQSPFPQRVIHDSYIFHFTLQSSNNPDKISLVHCFQQRDITSYLFPVD
jgi:hypothetical protein